MRHDKETELALGMWVKLARAFTTMNRLALKDIAGCGLTQPQFGVVECLGHLGPLCLGELSRKMLVSGGNMTVVVDNLERDGLVERVPRREDRRQVEVKLTDKGVRLFRRVFGRHASYITCLASVLAPHEQEQLGDLLRKLGLGLLKNERS